MTWIEPEQWYRQLPTVHVAALGLIGDGGGRVLVTKASYRRWWDLPGGMADQDEPPSRTVVREVEEELGLMLDVRGLVATDWASPRGQRTRPLIAFVFDLGVVRDPRVVLQRSELEDWRWAAVDELDGLMPPWTVGRVRAAVRVAAVGAAACLVDGVELASLPISGLDHVE